METADDGTFDISFCYDVRVTPVGGAGVWRDEFGISQWGGRPLDQMEDDPVLGKRERIIRVRSWALEALPSEPSGSAMFPP